MKLQNISLMMIAVFCMSGIAQAQQRSASPQAQQDVARQQEILAARNEGALAVLRRVVITPAQGAWWTNKELLTRLGLTDDQKTKIERAFENHRYNLESSQKLLDSEETQLGRLLQADTIDRAAILAQIDHVTRARSEMERTNSVMTLEMREVLTRPQWMQLQQQQPTWFKPVIQYVAPNAVRTEIEVQRGGGGRGVRGQQ
jgi:Spy/CpxP family protein refolding chaperone